MILRLQAFFDKLLLICHFVLSIFGRELFNDVFHVLFNLHLFLHFQPVGSITGKLEMADLVFAASQDLEVVEMGGEELTTYGRNFAGVLDLEWFDCN